MGCRLGLISLCRAVAAGGAKALVMDAELVAVDRTNGNRLRAFQELSTRARGQVTSHEVCLCCSMTLGVSCVIYCDHHWLTSSP